MGKKYCLIIPSVVLCFAGDAFAVTNKLIEKPKPIGWSLDLGGQYTWMSFTTPPTYSGDTGGVFGKITYQKPKSFYGQLRSVYNIGTLNQVAASSRDSEWYSEFVGGYCFSIASNWLFTPYIGVGCDFLKDSKAAYSSYSPIDLKYQTNYGIFGIETHYAWSRFSLGVQAEALTVFNQYLSITGLTGSSWKMTRRAGFDVHLPIGYRVVKNIWFEVSPYYRFLPIGSSSVLALSDRDLTQAGITIAFRFFQ